MALICVLVATPASIAADPDSSWPQSHGPNRDNISDEIGLLKKWPDKGPPLLWTADDLGHGLSSVSIAAGRTYSRSKAPGAQGRQLVAHAVNAI